MLAANPPAVIRTEEARLNMVEKRKGLTVGMASGVGVGVVPGILCPTLATCLNPLNCPG